MNPKTTTKNDSSSAIDKAGLFSKSDKWLLFTLSLIMGGLIYLLFFKRDQLFPSETQVVGTIKTDSNIRLKRNGTLSWFNAYNGEKVYLRDMVYIPPNTQSSITFENKEIAELPEDTLIHFDEVTLENLLIYLREGMKARIIPKRVVAQKIEKNLPDIQYLINRLNELRQRTYDKIFTPKELLAPQAVNGKLSDLSLSDFEIVLIRPEAKEVLNAREERTLQFLWSKVPLKGMTYTIELAQEAKFKRVLQFNTPKGNQLFIQLDKPGPYFWRIKGHWKGEEITSNESDFVMKNVNPLDRSVSGER